jgi:hypothetical protein
MNLGAMLRAPATYANLEQKSGVAWGLGLQVRALDALWLAGEVYGDTVLDGRAERSDGVMGHSSVLSPIEWLGGLRWKPDHRFTVGLAVGRGLTSAVGTPAFRGVLSLTLTPGASEPRPIRPTRPRPQRQPQQPQPRQRQRPVIDTDRDGIPDRKDRCVNEAEDRNGRADGDGCPDADADRDGLIDVRDRCPRKAEDQDGFQDQDGCPELDNDRDGIADRKDRCVNEAEDRNRIADGDGCPDGDADHDAIVDVRDRCPRQAEDRDGFQDQDGCPELDNDGDGLADAQDRCPLKPETINGNQDDDGCPDEGGDPAARVAVDPGLSPEQAAEATFKRGRELMLEKKYFAACTAFEQSQRLDPRAGTQYNLALCYAEIGKLATALNLHRELVRFDKNAERQQKATELATQLAARVPKIKLNLVGMPADISVFMNGTNVNALIGIESPVDFGRYTIVAGAPGYRGWRQVVEVKQEGELVTVDIDLGAPVKP